MEFCIRDDDTSFFTSPDQLEAAYGDITQCGPVSLAVVPFHRAGTSKAVPAEFRGHWTVHPLHRNESLVKYLRHAIAKRKFEIMLHGYYHDERNGRAEFAHGDHLAQRVDRGRKYLEDLLGARVRVFVPPRNAIGKKGLKAIERAGLHLCGTAGVRHGWPLTSYGTWRLWLRLRRWSHQGGLGVPWILDLGGHREIAANAVTPVASFQKNGAVFAHTSRMGGVFCAATHYWELETPSKLASDPPVGQHLQNLIALAVADPQVRWRSVGDVVSESTFVL
jgi:uncharacterized protein DUF2334